MEQIPGHTDHGKSDDVIATIRRGDGRELRVVRTEYRGATYTHIREWFFSAGEWRPGKGIALRESEIAQVASALDRAAGVPDAPDPTAGWGA